jgi:hypothetical protein
LHRDTQKLPHHVDWSSWTEEDEEEDEDDE